VRFENKSQLSGNIKIEKEIGVTSQVTIIVIPLLTQVNGPFEIFTLDQSSHQQRRKNMTSRNELLRLLAEAEDTNTPTPLNWMARAVAAIRELLEQKPVAVNNGNGFITPHGDPVPLGPLYALPVVMSEKEKLT
jgi:hypothetical protein